MNAALSDLRKSSLRKDGTFEKTLLPSYFYHKRSNSLANAKHFQFYFHSSHMAVAFHFDIRYAEKIFLCLLKDNETRSHRAPHKCLRIIKIKQLK